MSLIKFYTKSFTTRPYLTLLVTNSILMSIGDSAAQSLFFLQHLNDDSISTSYDLIRTLRFSLYGALVGPLGGKWFQFLDSKFPLTPTTPPSSSSKLPTNSLPIQSNSISAHSTTSTSQSVILNELNSTKSPNKSILGRDLNHNNQTENKTKEDQQQQQQSTQTESKPSILALFKRVLVDQLIMAPAALLLFLSFMSSLENGIDYDKIKSKIKENFNKILIANYKVWPLLQLINFWFIPLRFRIPFASICGIAWTGYLSLSTQNKVIEPEEEEVVIL